MKITTRHPQSKHGRPVIISDAGQVMNYPRGVEAVLERLKLHPDEAAKMAGVKRPTVDHYRKGRQLPSAAFLNVLTDAMIDAGQQPEPPQ